jgi:hypothetical protein
MTTATIDLRGEDPYPPLAAAVQDRFNAMVSTGNPVFTTDAEGLYTAYLNGLPGAWRQHHTCTACRRFIETYGGLVTIAEDGRTQSVLWEPEGAPQFYAAAVAAMAQIVTSARVTGVFVSSASIWGTPRTDEWAHLAVTPPARMVYGSRTLAANQRAAELLHDYQTLQLALANLSPDVVDQAVRLLESDHLYRSEKVIGPARWLQELHAVLGRTRDARRRINITWRAVATAPAGFTHPRSTMIGTLLEDIAAGLDFEQVRRRFQAKMHPLQYQRPQAAPAAGNIAQAERLVEQLGIARALERRYARLDEVEALWRPAPPQAAASPSGGVFSHLTPKQARPTRPAMQLPRITMTWVKFRDTVLPKAEQLQLLVPGGMASFGALVTAVHSDAPPILQWDTEEQRNPVSWYLWHGGSPADWWGLRAGVWTEVTAITLKPSSWYGRVTSNQADAALLILEGAQDRRSQGAGLALFPETLKSELHPIRATIEAHSRSGQIQGAEQASACGYLIGSQGPINIDLQATTAAGVQAYQIDRWD